MNRGLFFFAISILLVSIVARAQDLPDAPTPVPASASGHTTTRADKVFSVLALPGYGKTLGDSSLLGKTQRFVLVADRFSATFDTASTGMAVSSGSKESNPVYALFGNQNRAGVASLMSAGEFTLSFAAAAGPNWVGRHAGRRWKKIAQVAAIIGVAYVAQDHMRCGIYDLRTRK